MSDHYGLLVTCPRLKETRSKQERLVGSMFRIFNEFKGSQKSLVIQVDVGKLNRFSVQTGRKLAEQDDFNQLSKEPKLKKVNQSYFMFSNNASEVFKVISHSKKTSFGHDGLNMMMSKIIAPVISQYISKDSYCCISRGEFTNFLKFSKVIPLFKSGDALNPNNY